MHNEAMDREVLIIGTGSQARVVAEILRARGRCVHGFVPPAQGTEAGGTVGLDPSLAHPVLGWEEACRLQDAVAVIVGVGDNATRRRETERAEAAGFILTSAVHPSAVIGSGTVIGAGTVVAASAVCVLDVVIGKSVIINTGASVDHDGRIGDFCHVGPGAVLAGRVILEAGVFAGAGCVIKQNMTVGGDTVLGAGSVVIKDIPSGVVAVGVPARALPGKDGP